MPENLLGLLKICLLILIYLFFVRVLWAVWSEVRAVRPQTEPGGRPPHDDRAGGCHIALPNDTFASTLHARVFERNGAVYVEDLGSTNGTYVNGNRLAAPVVLRPGDRLQVGTTVLEAS